jgi:uncharacterized membrane protein
MVHRVSQSLEPVELDVRRRIAYIFFTIQGGHLSAHPFPIVAGAAVDVSSILQSLFRWIHVVSAIMAVGLVYWTNFMNAQFFASVDAGTRTKVMTGLIPRVMYWGRWAAAYMWITGLFLLFIVYYHGGLMVGEESMERWTMGQTGIVLALLVVAVYVYDALARSPLASNGKVFGVVAFVLIVGLVWLMISVGKFGYRAYVIHLGALFGSVMTFNIWYRVYPLQRKIMASIQEGTPPDQSLVMHATMRSRHAAFLSIPIVYTMIAVHTVVPGADSPLYLLGAVVLGWMVVAMLFKKSASVKGME